VNPRELARDVEIVGAIGGTSLESIFPMETIGADAAN
jgi:hypothetical protein